MSLSPGWVERLGRHGFEAVHWSTVGPATAPDAALLSWARERGDVLLTHDLDFSAILAGTSEQAPSVLQLRMHDLMSERAVEAVVSALEVHAAAIAQGALVSIDEGGGRVRILPVR